MSVAEQLEERWQRLWPRLNRSGAALWPRLLAAYGQPSRAYHGLQHLADCFRELDEVSGLPVPSAELELALWLHDVVYDTHASDNEMQSAGLAAEWLRSAGVDEASIARVEDLILITRHDRLPRDADEELIIDVDLAILGQPADVYDVYERAIRKEYAWVDVAAYRSGRAAVLRRFLGADVVYHTAPFRQRYEVAARINLQRALAGLASVE